MLYMHLQQYTGRIYMVMLNYLVSNLYIMLTHYQKIVCHNQQVLCLLYIYFPQTILATLDQTDVPETIQQLRALMAEVQTNATLNAEFAKHFQQWKSLNATPSVPSFSCKMSEYLGRSTVKPTSGMF